MEIFPQNSKTGAVTKKRKAYLKSARNFKYISKKKFEKKQKYHFCHAV